MTGGDMRGYWLKIILKAMAVFAIGYAGVWVVRTQVSRVRHTIESAEPINVPLAFLPFTLDGARIGTYRGVRIVRSAPKTVSAVHIRVRLSDTIPPARFEGCRLTTMNAASFSPDEGMRCVSATAADSLLIPFGDVRLEVRGAGDVLLPLLLDSAVVSDLSGSRAEAAAGQLGRHEAEAARASAGMTESQARRMADSIRARVEAKVKVEVKTP